MSPELQEFFDSVKHGYHREEDLASVMRKHIMTQEHKDFLHRMNWSVEELMRGRNEYPANMTMVEVAEVEDQIRKMFKQWNKTIGFDCWGN